MEFHGRMAFGDVAVWPYGLTQWGSGKFMSRRFCSSYKER